MSTPFPRPYVADVRKGEVIVVGLPEQLPNWPCLGSHSCKRMANGEHRISAAGKSQVALLQELSDHNVAFAGGTHGWPPAEVFADLRDRGLVRGEFEELVFKGSGSWTSRQR